MHTDVSDLIRKPSLIDALYFIAFQDYFTGFRVVKKQKIEIKYSPRLENETGHRIITIRSDNGGEYTSYELKAWLKVKKEYATKQVL